MSKRLEMLTQVQRDPREAERRPLELKMFRRMFSYTRPYRGVMRALIFCVVVRSMQVPLLAWALSAVIRGPISQGNLTRLAMGVTGYAVLAIWTDYNLYHRQRLALLLGENVVHDMRADIFSKLQTMTMGFFNRTKMGRLISRMTSDAEAVRLGLQNSVFVSIVATGQMTIAAAIMFWTDWGLFAVMLATAPLYYVTYQYFRRRLSDASRDVQESYARVFATMAESVAGIRVTQGYVRQDLNARLFGELVADHAEYNVAVARASGTFNPALELMNQVVVALLFIVAGYRVLHPSVGVSVEALVTFYFLISEVLNPLAALGRQYNAAVAAMAGGERVFSVLDRKPDFEDPPDAVEPPPLQGRVEFRDLGFSYLPDKPVLKEISFTAQPGQTIALVGATGSGKTTIINLIAKFYLPGSGQLLIDGLEIRRLKTHALHRQMGIVLQNNFLFSGTVIDNIRMGRSEATDEQVMEAARRIDVLDLILDLPEGFQTEVGERGASLSLGQRQLICFARAMLADPRILILDEATSSVDTLTEARIQNALGVLLKGRTSFVVAHRLSTIRQADKILVLNHGEIVERGTHTELLATGGVYAHLYQRFIRTSGE